MIHSMVEFVDGSTIAQAGPPRMLVPIALGMSWPERIADADVPVDWTQAQSWEFEPLDDDAFPAVALARRVGEAGGTWPAVYNAANEVAVDAFVEGRLPFLGIVDTVAEVLDSHENLMNVTTLADVERAEGWARRQVRQLVAKGTSA
jgi:1-deoxy-D-xylulose-5-phosphate reductoisomerase